MASLGFFIYFCLTCLLFVSEGKVSAPSSGTSSTFAPGSTGRISWSFDDVIDPITRRVWTFTPSNGQPRVSLATIDDDDPVKIFTNLLDFAVEKPATLVLKNVNLTYNGTYQFVLSPSVGVGSSEVVVYIAVTPQVKVDCDSLSTVNVTDNFTCLCEASGGNPTAYVTWYKGNNKIGESGKEEKTLRLINVGRDDAGIYRCEAKSHDSAINETEIELIVNYPPENVMLKLTRSDNFVTITCSAEAQPSASFKIFFNEIELVSTNKTYTIPEVNISHVGNYSCAAKNILGAKTSNSIYLSRQGQTQTSTSSTTIKRSPTTQIIASSTVNGAGPTTTKPRTTAPLPSPSPSPLPTGAIIGIVIGVLLFLLIVGIVAYCCKSKQKERRNHRNVDTVAGNHYELENEPSPGDNAYDTVGPVGESGSKKKAPEKDSLPPVYAAVDKNNRQGNTLYASLDTDAMKPKRESKKEPERTPQTEYASIDFAKSTEVPKADLV